jgi:hypothetical protein
MRYSRQWIGPCRGLVQKHAQHPSLAPTEELDVKNFESAGGGDPVRNSPDTINVKRHESNNLLADGRITDGASN